MTPEQLIAVAEAKVADADRNLASCAASLEAHRQRAGGVPNVEVISLTHAQATVGQAYSALAMAKTARQLLATEEAVKQAQRPAHVLQAEALREMAERIDRGPTFPVPPSVISALVRERADSIEGETG